MMIFVSVRGDEGTASRLSCSHRSVFGGNGAMCVWNVLYSCETFLERKAAVDISVAVALGVSAERFEAQRGCNPISASKLNSSLLK